MRAALGRVRAWLRGHGAELRLGVRMTASGLIAFALAELLGLAQGYWAVFTAIIVVQASVGGSLKAGLDQLLGTLGGAAYGALVGLAIPHADPVMRGRGARALRSGDGRLPPGAAGARLARRRGGAHLRAELRAAGSARRSPRSRRPRRRLRPARTTKAQ